MLDQIYVRREKMTEKATVRELSCRELSAAVRRQAIVDAATLVFLEQGYGGTTMSCIAATVGGSKSTLWSYFSSKEALFVAVVDDIIERHSEAQMVELPPDGDITMVLKLFAQSLTNTLTSAPILNLYRLVISEAKRFPHLAELFYDRGPKRGRARLAVYIAEMMERGELRRGDPLVAAQQLCALCQSGTFQLVLLDLATPDQNSMFASDIDVALDTFCRAWRS
ncbi:TetR/AcrR family transcriptional regulator [Novosphingobium sp.]|uniref:TetR/AcrR family transcriptional regulator n=1 Tax=Novosphingobium sp. TaxID=1874826 RepID=UPI002FE07932